MKLSIIGTASLLFGAAVGIVEGQDRPGGRGPGSPGGEHRPAPADIAKNLSERFASLAAFDTDKSGKLDDTEQAAVAKAVEAGTLEAGPSRPDKGKGEGRPKGDRPSGSVIAGHVAKLYESVAAYDADEAKGTHFLVMEYVDGCDLSALVKKNGPLGVEAAVDAILQAAKEIRARQAEKRAEHQDSKTVKPQVRA